MASSPRPSPPREKTRVGG